MPFRTVLATLKLVANVVAVKVRSPTTALLRESNATSDGEFTRVGTFPEGGLTESNGKTLYISMFNRVTSSKDAPLGKSPMKVAWLTVVSLVVIKSSAGSILVTPGLDGLEAEPIKPSGDPVLKLNGEVACAQGTDSNPEKTIPTNNSRRIIGAVDDPKGRFKSLKHYHPNDVKPSGAKPHLDESQIQASTT
jgi:hypothetical protein